LKFIPFLFLLIVDLVAQDNYSFRVAYGMVTSSDLGEIFLGNIKKHPYDLRVLAFDGGYLIKEEAFELPLDFYLKVGVSHFDEAATQSDITEGILYIKAYWNFLDKKVRVGFGEGASYTSNVLMTEYLEATEKKDHYSRILNYLDISVDMNIGKIFDYKALKNTYFGYAIKHRSGVGGLINSVSHGGSNYNTLYIESNF